MESIKQAFGNQKYFWDPEDPPTLNDFVKEYPDEFHSALKLMKNLEALRSVYPPYHDPLNTPLEGLIKKRLHLTRAVSHACAPGIWCNTCEFMDDPSTWRDTAITKNQIDLMDLFDFAVSVRALVQRLNDTSEIALTLARVDQAMTDHVMQHATLTKIIDEKKQPPAAPRPNKAAPAVGPPLLNFTDAMRRDIEILQGSGIIKGNGSARPNFKDKRDAVALFDLWDDYYDIYGEYPNAKVIQESVMVKGREFRDVASVRSRNASAIEQRKLEILSLLPHLKK